jgi:hypothetical protein
MMPANAISALKARKTSLPTTIIVWDIGGSRHPEVRRPRGSAADVGDGLQDFRVLKRRVPVSM